MGEPQDTKGDWQTCKAQKWCRRRPGSRTACHRARRSWRGGELAEQLRGAPRVNLGSWPTPIQRVTRPGQCDLLVKRDDLSGFGRGGAKTRKLSHLLGHVRASGHGELMAVAGNVTNLAFDLLQASGAFGLRTRLFIVNDPPATPGERAGVFAGVLGSIELLTCGRAEAAAVVLRAYAAAWHAGRKPFLALPGAFHPACVIGNACGFLEMVEQLESQGAPLPRTVFVTAATGTTVAGFLLAADAASRCRRSAHPGHWRSSAPGPNPAADAGPDTLDGALPRHQSPHAGPPDEFRPLSRALRPLRT